MGYDIIGIKSKNGNGKYFRNSIGQWRPLWHCICNNTEELTDYYRYRGQHNDDIIIDGELHSAVVRTLQQLLSSRLKSEVKRALKQSPYLEWNGKKTPTVEMAIAHPSGWPYSFEWDNVVNFLQFCKNNEGFQIS